MALASNLDTRVRLRITEIELQPVISERPIKAEIHINGKLVKNLPGIAAGQPLRWPMLMVCDTYASFRAELVVYEKRRGIHSRYESASCLVSEIIQSPTKSLAIDIDDKQYIIHIKLLSQFQAEALFARGLGKLSEMGLTNDAPNKLEDTRRVFKWMLEFGNAVSEALPMAKLVFAVCTCAWENKGQGQRVKEQEKFDQELDNLARRLVGMAPLVEEVKKYAHLPVDALLQNIVEFLNLIEDVSIFAMRRETRGSIVRVFQALVDSGDRERIDDLAKRFKAINGAFRAAIGIQAIAMAAREREERLLKQLNHVEPSGHDPSQGCQDGTRLSVLTNINHWVHSSDPSPPLMWIYGQAGIGKSTIAASVCNALAENGYPAVSFFCKRDDPMLRDPLRLMNSIVYGLAYRYPPYGKLVAGEIGNNPELCTSHLEVRYEGLLKQPLNRLKDHRPRPRFIVVLIDGLDECKNDTNQQTQLLQYLQELTLLVPWLRVIVTSRPDSNISIFFDQFSTTTILPCNLHSFSAIDDIRAFVTAKLGTIAINDEWPQDGIERLCSKAGELFIWASTACKYIINGFDSLDRLHQLTNSGGNPYHNGFGDLDSLYAALIENSTGDLAEDSVAYMRQCIGTIVVTSTKQPMSMEVLCELMRSYVKPGILQNVIRRLGAVLYIDEKLHGAVRVYHPSFADFVLDKRRSGDFWIDPIRRNAELSAACLSIMERELRFNICDLETSYQFNAEIHNLTARIQERISGQLIYSCKYWVSHLVDSTVITLKDRVEQFINGPRLLYWIEVLSLLQQVDVALRVLRELGLWLSCRSDAIQYIWDVCRFILAFYDPITASTPHMYLSALSVAPKESELSRRLLSLFPYTATVIDGEDETWPAWLRSISHLGCVTSLCVSRDGRLLVTGCEDGTVRAFDLTTGGLIRVLCRNSPSGQWMRVVVSSDGTLVARSSEEGNVQLWDANSGMEIFNIQIKDPGGDCVEMREMTFSHDMTTLHMLTTYENASLIQITRLNIESKTISHEAIDILQDDSDITAIALSPDGAYVAVGGLHGLTWRANTSSKSINGLDIDGLPLAIVFSPNNSLVASNASPGHCEAHIWDVETGNVVGSALVGHIESIHSLAFSSDEARIVTGSNDCTVRIWDTRTGNMIGGPLLGHHDYITSIAFSADGTYVVSGSWDKTVLIWDSAGTAMGDTANTSPNTQASPTLAMHSQRIKTANTQEAPRTTADTFSPHGHSDTVFSVSFSSDGTRIASGSADYTVRSWDSQTGISIGEPLLEDCEVSHVAYSRISNDDRILIAANDNPVIWEAGIGIRVPIDIQTTGYMKYMFSPDGTLLASIGSSVHRGPSEGVLIWDTLNGNTVGRLDGAFLDTSFMAFSPDNSLLYTGDSRSGSKVCVWDVRAQTVLANWSAGNFIIFLALSPDGSSIASCSRMNHSIIVHDAQTGDTITGPLRGHTSRIHSIAFSPDGCQMASGSEDRTIRLWDLKLGIAISSPLIGHLGPVLSVAFSPDGTRLASGSKDTTIRVWDVTQKDEAEFLPHPTNAGWVSHDRKSLAVWLPVHYRQKYDPRALVCITADPLLAPIRIDFSKFVHGTDWASVVNEEALRNWRWPK